MGRTLKRFGTLLVVGLFVLAGCSGGNANELVIGMECGYAPFNWVEPNGDNGGVEIGSGQYCNGYDVDIAKAIAEDLDRELVIQKTSWDGLILALQSDQIDGIIAGMSPTSERKQEIDFSDVYHLGEFGMMVRKDGPFANAKSVADFENAIVSAQLGTFHVDLLAQLTNAKVLDPMKDFPAMTIALIAGELDGFVAEDATGAAVTASNPELVYIPLVGDTGFAVLEEFAGVSVGIKKGNDLLGDVNKSLAKITPEERKAYMSKAISANQ